MSELLSSEALERQFGPTKLEVLKQDMGGRIICTKIEETGKVLELSWVVFRPENDQLLTDPDLASAHQAVLDGASMGKAFSDAGLPFRRNVHASYLYDHRTLPAEFSKRFGSKDPPTVTDLTVHIGPDAIPYADIIEVFSPDVHPWELTGGDMGDEVANRLQVFGAELEALDDYA